MKVWKVLRKLVWTSCGTYCENKVIKTMIYFWNMQNNVTHVTMWKMLWNIKRSTFRFTVKFRTYLDFCIFTMNLPEESKLSTIISTNFSIQLSTPPFLVSSFPPSSLYWCPIRFPAVYQCFAGFRVNVRKENQKKTDKTGFRPAKHIVLAILPTHTYYLLSIYWFIYFVFACQFNDPTVGALNAESPKRTFKQISKK